MKKGKIHYSDYYGKIAYHRNTGQFKSECGLLFDRPYITNIRKKVTCEKCKSNYRFKQKYKCKNCGRIFNGTNRALLHLCDRGSKQEFEIIKG